MATQPVSALHPLRDGEKGEPARVLQAAANRRLRTRGLGALAVEEDGEMGPLTIEAVRKAAWALGARLETCEAIEREQAIPVGVQRMIRNPGRRSDEQLRRGKCRLSRMRAARKRRAREQDHGSARHRAVSAFVAKVGTRENPAGSNSGGIITAMEAFWGFGRVPWCGISSGYHAKKYGGVQGLQSDVACVAAIERHARAGTKPYGHWQPSPQGALPGSLVVIGGSGVHVGMLVEPLADGGARTVEGNTSFGPGGSQSNGGCIALRTRSAGEITGVATMDYPG
jgi:hypothetical protein